MAAPDVTALQATIHELRAELSQCRIQAEVFRALYTRQAVEIEHLRSQIDEDGAGAAPRRLQLVARGCHEEPPGASPVMVVQS